MSRYVKGRYGFVLDERACACPNSCGAAAAMSLIPGGLRPWGSVKDDGGIRGAIRDEWSVVQQPMSVS